MALFSQSSLGPCRSPDCSMTSRRAVIKDCKVGYTRSGQPFFYLSESEESSETQSSDSSETETDDDGSDAMDTDNDPSLYEFNPTDSDREQFHKPDPFPPREKFPYPEAHTQREQPFNSPRASSPPTASSSGSSSGPQPSPSRPQPNLTYRGSTSHASNTVPTPPPPPPPAEPSSNLNLVSSDNGAQSGDICKPESWVYVQRAQNSAPTAVRIVEILAREGAASLKYPGNVAVIENSFFVLDVKDPRLNMPVLVPAQVDSILVYPKEILLALNAQHDCVSCKCTAAAVPIHQERITTSPTELRVSHSPEQRFLINMHALHNAHLIRDVLPRSLTAPTPYLQDLAASYPGQLRAFGKRDRPNAPKLRQKPKQHGVSEHICCCWRVVLWCTSHKHH
ncbi:hypothetical protein R3P38DRAFT_3212995 [Favolaschia claudopus]|uniref:Uncharacterized protein n=1 Tax=Favolaschia claudopus TaxID=2862362 RepID=A0AAW0ADE9_9AGAR